MGKIGRDENADKQVNFTLGLQLQLRRSTKLVERAEVVFIKCRRNAENVTDHSSYLLAMLEGSAGCFASCGYIFTVANLVEIRVPHSGKPDGVRSHKYSVNKTVFTWYRWHDILPVRVPSTGTWRETCEAKYSHHHNEGLLYSYLEQVILNDAPKLIQGLAQGMYDVRYQGGERLALVGGTDNHVSLRKSDSDNAVSNISVGAHSPARRCTRVALRQGMTHSPMSHSHCLHSLFI